MNLNPQEIREAGQVAVLGMGRSGVAAARLARGRGAEVLGVDEGDPRRLEGVASSLGEIGVKVVVGERAADAARAADADLLVLSPGVPPEATSLVVFRDRKIPVVSEIEFAAAHGRDDLPVLGITGTNGKTTTTALLADILNAGGLTTVPGGNFGKPYSEIVDEGLEGDAITLELSSFQLEEIGHFRPHVAIWLNFAADHLDRYSDLESYRRAKLRIFDNQGSGDFAVVRAGEDSVLEAVAARGAEVVTFSSEPGVPGDLVLDDQSVIRFRGEPILSLPATRLRGLHNAENAMAAAGAARLLDIDSAVIQRAAEAFRPPRHRSELVAIVDGREFINDSKATNLHALEYALRGQVGSVVLIAGGKAKGLDFRPLVPGVERSVRALVAIGEIADELVEVFGGVVPAETAPDLESAVRRAHSLSNPGDTVLLSPGTSSFDMFSGYEERGDVFATCARNLLDQ